MALKAGRVGVHPDDVDLNGHIKNNSGDLSAYLKKSEAPGYNDILTQTSATSIYQTQSGMSNYQEKLESGTNIKTINNESLLGSGNIVIQGGGGDLSAYVQKSEAPGYNDILTETEASSIYQTQSGMSNYVLKSEATGYNDILTETEASSIYQTQSGMSNYVLKSEATGYNDILTETEASSTYQTQSGMSNYVLKSEATGYNDILTETEASSTYQPILVSGTNIKTIDNVSLLGTGNISSKFYSIDSSNIIRTGALGTTLYTATERCVVIGGLNSSGAAQNIYVNGVVVGYMADYDFVIIPLEVGDTIQATGPSGKNWGFNWYTFIVGVK